MKRLIAVATLGLAMLPACSGGKTPQSSTETQQAAKPAPKPSETETGRTALQLLYATARQWQTDAEPYRLESTPTKDANGHDGKAALWRGHFASPAFSSQRAIQWSGVSDDEDRGIRKAPEESWSASNTTTRPFQITDVKIDSDAALRTAQKHTQKLGKDADTLPVFYTLDVNPQKRAVVWHVAFGENRNDAKITVDVDAGTGGFIRIEQ